MFFWLLSLWGVRGGAVGDLQFLGSWLVTVAGVGALPLYRVAMTLFFSSKEKAVVLFIFSPRS